MIKLPFILLGLLIFVTPVHAQDGLTDGERIARLEGAYEHLATKSDIGNLRVELQKDMNDLRSELESKIDNNGYITWAIIVIVSIFGGRARRFFRIEPPLE